jgi:hypothetical protein
MSRFDGFGCWWVCFSRPGTDRDRITKYYKHKSPRPHATLPFPEAANIAPNHQRPGSRTLTLGPSNARAKLQEGTATAPPTVLGDNRARKNHASSVCDSFLLEGREISAKRDISAKQLNLAS